MSVFKLLSFTIFTLAFSANSWAQNPYYPLKKGSETHYEYASPFATSDDQYAVISVLDEEQVIKGESYIIVQTKLVTDGNETLMDNTFLRNEKNGRIVGMTGEESPESELFPAQPWTVGTTWNQTKDGIDSKTTITEIDASIDTPNGKLDHCLVVETEVSGIISTAYFQKGIGLVAFAMNNEGQSMLMMYITE